MFTLCLHQTNFTMARIKIILYKSKTYSDGRHPLMIQITHKRITKRISLNRQLFADEWDEESGLPTKGATHYQSITSKVIEKRATIDRILTEIEREKADYHIDEIVNKFKSPSVQISFTEYFKEIHDRLLKTKKYGNAEAYQSALNSLVRFAGKENILFSEIDYKFLVKWREFHVGNGNSVNGHNVYLKPIRAVFNRAISEEIISANNYPFKTYKLSSKPTKKRALAKEDMQKIVDLDLIEDSDLWHTRNLFLFSFFTIGMSWVDLAYLKLSNVKGGRIDYARKKTGKDYSIQINEKIDSILKYYSKGKKQSEFIFPILFEQDDLKRIRERKNSLRKHNDRLIKIASLAGITDDITSYVARHSWASIANFSGIHIGVISQGMGHSDIKTTQIYLANFDRSDIDSANANIL